MGPRTTPRVILLLSFAVAIALALVAVTLVLVTGKDVSEVEGNQSVVVGPEGGLAIQIDALGAVYYANPFGGDGFWLTELDGALVALALRQSGGDEPCELEFDPEARVFERCGAPVAVDELTQLPLTVDDGKVTVDIRTPVAATSPSAG